MSARHLGPGDVIGGKYRVERTLGEGGMAYVLGARSIALDEPVAIKVLKPMQVSSPEAVARFFREARAAVRMKGEHVAKVLDVGALDDGTPYMLMELLEGSDLQAVVERSGPLPVATAVDFVLQTCEALAEAHALGIVHRDIKPSNLFLTVGVDGSPSIKVLDFGISKATSAIDATRPDFGLTDTQTVMGSPQYMAPEQMRSSRRVDARTDIWALGTIMHELLIGKPPFAATSMPELFAMILQDTPPSLSERRPEVPAELDAVVQRCLQKNPDARPEDVHEVARLLAPFASVASAGVADRVARVGMNVAVATKKNIAAVKKAKETTSDPPPPVVPDKTGTLVSKGSRGSEVPAFAVAPSGSELGLANTTRLDVVDVPIPARPRPRLVALLAAAVTIIVGGGAVLALRVTRPPRADVGPRTASSLATPSSAAVAPPPAIDPPVLATNREPPIDPPAASVVGSASAVPAVPVAKRPGRQPAPARSTASPAPIAAPPQPATTASSRYD